MIEYVDLGVMAIFGGEEGCELGKGGYGGEGGVGEEEILQNLSFERGRMWVICHDVGLIWMYNQRRFIVVENLMMEK